MPRPLKSVRIRAVNPELWPDPRGPEEGLRYWVTAESEAAVSLDNFARYAAYRSRVTLSKLPGGLLENSAGTLFELLPDP